MHEKSKSTLESSRQVLEAVIPVLEGIEPFENDVLFANLKEFAKTIGFKVGTVMWPHPDRPQRSGSLPPGGATELAAMLGGKTKPCEEFVWGLEKLI